MRRKVTTGMTSDLSSGGNGDRMKSGPFGGEPEEPSATSFVYSCVSFFAPVSTKRALDVCELTMLPHYGEAYRVSDVSVQRLECNACIQAF